MDIKQIKERYLKKFWVNLEAEITDRNLAFWFQLLEEQEKAIKAELREKLRTEEKKQAVSTDVILISYQDGYNQAVQKHNRLLDEALGGEDDK